MNPLISLPAAFGASLLGLLHRSWEVRTTGLERLDDLLGQGKPVLVIFWHGKYLPLFPLLQGRGACVFASQSLRGEIICALCRRFGHNCLMLDDHADLHPLATMRQAMARNQLMALAPDGPRGPYHQIKPGLIRLSGEFDLTLLPASVAAHPRLVLKHRWDRMEVPWPYARVSLAFGAPLEIPRDLDHPSLLLWADRVREALETAEAQAMARLE
jgi:lysophospholipid acyltransferase (LPLAT)-like uncharacterized protein